MSELAVINRLDKIIKLLERNNRLLKALLMKDEDKEQEHEEAPIVFPEPRMIRRG